MDKGSDHLISRVNHLADHEMPYQVDAFYRRWDYDAYDACAGQKVDKEALTVEVEASKLHGSMRTLGLTGLEL